MSKRLALLLSKAFLLFAITLSWASSAAVVPAQNARGGVVENEVSIKLKGLDGKTYDVAAMRGDVVVASFGATWCAPCAFELAAIEELKKEYKDKRVRFFWISIENEETTSDALLRHYAREQRVSIPVLRDPTRAAFAQFSQIVRIPLVVFFDQTGRFTAPAHRGMSSDPEQYKKLMRGRLDALLARPAGSGAATNTR